MNTVLFNGFYFQEYYYLYYSLKTHHKMMGFIIAHRLKIFEIENITFFYTKYFHQHLLR